MQKKIPTRHSALPFPTISTTRALDRLTVRRSDDALVEKLYADPAARVLVMVDLDVSLEPDQPREAAAIRWFNKASFDELGLEADELILLGIDSDGQARFAATVGAAQLARTALATSIGDLEPLADLRTLAIEGTLSSDDLSMVGEARALAGWHRGRRCCGRCGARTRTREAGWRRECWACGQNYFPRSDPAVIMLISDGDHCLLGRHKKFREGFYSVLAGFVEPGEDIEDAVRRETFEEAGVEVGRVDYMGSQPWPFPHSLMIGCWGEALSSQITCDDDELADVRWFSRGEVQDMVESRHAEGIDVPGKLSIARALIDRFAKTGAP